jgi:probable F420-dependent oxidoreductase
MKIGFFAIGIANFAQPEFISNVSQHAERLGFATIWAPEHLLFVEKYSSKYPYARGENLPVATDIPLLNPLIALTYAAANTKRIRLATGICLVPEYNPLLLAKMCASLDYLSGGRFALGIGIGWLREEFEALGIPWEHRAKRTREYIEAMRCLWSEQHNYKGEFVKFSGALSYPKPIKRNRLPILVGGQTEAALKRAAAYGDGWCGFNLNPEETAQMVKRIKELLKEHGREREPFEYSMSPVHTATADDIKGYRDAGIDELYVAPVFRRAPGTAGEAVKLVEEVARDWVEPAQKV